MSMLRALLIGSSHAGLHVEPSVDAMHTWLLRHGFDADEIECLTGVRATRDEILAGLRRLAEAEHGDAPVLVYYAGHGHLYRTEIGADAGEHAAYPLLVATDIDASADGTLRSVLGSELSRELQQIAVCARNLTVILDCCHASGMVRLDDDLGNDLVRANELALRVEASARIARSRGPVTRGASLGPPERLSERVVVVAASSSGGRAYPDPTTERMVFTDALLVALDRHVTWDAVLAETRARVQAVWAIQHPAVFGPRFRRPFTLEEHLPDGELYHVERRGEHVVLRAGALGNIHVRDQFELITFASTTYGPESVLGRVEPYSIQPDYTVVRAPPAVRALIQPCYARRVERGERPAVAVVGAEVGPRSELAGVLASARLRVAVDGGDVIARVEVRDGMLRVFDGLGELVHVAPADPLPVENLRRCLERLDRWSGVSRWIASDSFPRPLRRCYEVRWGRAGATPTSGELRVRPGEALALSLRNLDRGEPELYAQAFRIRADREIRAWNAETGAQFFAVRQGVAAGQQEEQGAHVFTLDMPPALPPGVYREWTLVAVSNEPFDDDLLETPLHARALATGFDRSWGLVTRGEEDARRLDIVAFPYSLELS